MSERPIFIVGAPRSGTTMLRFMLCAHPNIYIPPESNFFPRVFRLNSNAPLSQKQAVQLLWEIKGYKVFFRDWQDIELSPEDFVSNLPDLRPATILRALYVAYARQNNAIRWGDKTPIYSTHVLEIASLFPNAFFIHIIRDGRDVALSMKKAYQGTRFFYIDIYYAASSWKNRVQGARSAGKMLGSERYLELKYQELTYFPEQSLKKVCWFIGENYNPEMVNPHRVAKKQYHSTGIHHSTRQPLTTKSVGKWQNNMTSTDRRIFHLLAGDLLAELGYEIPERERLTSKEFALYSAMKLKYITIETGRRMLLNSGVSNPASIIQKVLKGETTAKP